MEVLEETRFLDELVGSHALDVNVQFSDMLKETRHAGEIVSETGVLAFYSCERACVVSFSDVWECRFDKDGFFIDIDDETGREEIKGVIGVFAYAKMFGLVKQDCSMYLTYTNSDPIVESLKIVKESLSKLTVNKKKLPPVQADNEEHEKPVA